MTVWPAHKLTLRPIDKVTKGSSDKVRKPYIKWQFGNLRKPYNNQLTNRLNHAQIDLLTHWQSTQMIKQHSDSLIYWPVDLLTKLPTFWPIEKYVELKTVQLTNWANDCLNNLNVLTNCATIFTKHPYSWPTEWLTKLATHQLTKWLYDWLNNREISTNWPSIITKWLTSWLSTWAIQQLINLPSDLLAKGIGYSTGWLTNTLADEDLGCL